jgi:TPR repeat protein
MQGLAKATFNLGLMYEKQRGVAVELSHTELVHAAKDCYQSAATAGITKVYTYTSIYFEQHAFSNLDMHTQWA